MLGAATHTFLCHGQSYPCKGQLTDGAAARILPGGSFQRADASALEAVSAERVGKAQWDPDIATASTSRAKAEPVSNGVMDSIKPQAELNAAGVTEATADAVTPTGTKAKVGTKKKGYEG